MRGNLRRREGARDAVALLHLAGRAQALSVKARFGAMFHDLDGHRIEVVTRGA